MRKQIYQFALIILRDMGHESDGRTIRSRGTAETEGGSVTGEKGEDWRSLAVSERFLALKEGAAQHVLASPFDAYEILMGINREKTPGRMKTRVGTAWEESPYSMLNVMATTIDIIVWKMSKSDALREMRSER